MQNFYHTTDNDGKMPAMSKDLCTSINRKLWTKYVNDKPVEAVLMEGTTLVYDYQLQDYVSIDTLSKVSFIN